MLFSNNNLRSFLLNIKQCSFSHRPTHLFILLHTQMAQSLILEQVVLAIVSCSMTSHANEVSNTFKVKMNATGSKVCVVDLPSKVISMTLRAMKIHCGVKCNEDPSSKLFQMNEDLKQCELFTYRPQNFAAIDHCSAYAAYPGKHMVLKFNSEYSNCVSIQRPGLQFAWRHWNGWHTAGTRKLFCPWCCVANMNVGWQIYLLM